MIDSSTCRITWNTIAPASSRCWRMPAKSARCCAPDIPTITEAGYPGYVAVTSFGLFGRAGIPAAAAAAEYAAIVNEALASPAVVEALHKDGPGARRRHTRRVLPQGAGRPGPLGAGDQGIRHQDGCLRGPAPCRTMPAISSSASPRFTPEDLVEIDRITPVDEDRSVAPPYRTLRPEKVHEFAAMELVRAGARSQAAH